MPRGAEDTTGSNEADFGTFHQYIDESFDFLDTNWCGTHLALLSYCCIH